MVSERTITVGRAFLKKYWNVRIDSISHRTEEGQIWLERFLKSESELMHYGVKGQEWGVRNGPPYPLGQNEKSSKEASAEKKGVVKFPESSKILDKVTSKTNVKLTVNKEKQMRHTKSNHEPRRSYINGELDYAEELFAKYSGTGEPLMNLKTGKWLQKERVKISENIGYYVDGKTGKETPSNNLIISYSKTGSHLYPGRKGD